jgi:uncharacterized protein (TIGR03435 family)
MVEKIAITLRFLHALCLISAVAASAQQPSPPALHYDTVSIREAKRDANGSITMSGGFGDPHIATINLVNWSLQNIISYAFGSAYYQVEGIPVSLQDRFYVLRAQSGDETNAVLKPMADAQAKAAQHRMLQQVIVERFHLQYHTVDRDMPSFALVAGKHLRLHLSTAKPVVPNDGRIQDPSDPTQPTASERCERRGCSLTARGQSIHWLTDVLEAQLRGPIIDRTGITGLYDFTLSWGSFSDDTDDDEFPLLETAVSDQLGLRIERSKSSQHILIIDHLDAPTPN